MSLFLCSCTEPVHDITDYQLDPSEIDYSVIPRLNQVVPGESLVSLPQTVTVSTDLPKACREMLGETFRQMGVSMQEGTNATSFIRCEKSALPSEAYTLTSDGNYITLGAADPKGMVWATQTLRQLTLNNEIPMGEIKDAPAYAWRCVHLDVARHMFDLSTLKTLIDQMSFYKINYLLLQLSDDQGWRMEIKSFPKLAQTGAWRDFDGSDKECMARAATNKDMEIDPQFIKDGRYGGYYTQEQLSELVTYASERGVDIIPEIDMPGHMGAAISAYSWLACHGKVERSNGGNGFTYPICAGKKQTYDFVDKVLDEVMSIFPCKYIHIGEDEFTEDGSADVNGWKDCVDCIALKKSENLASDLALQQYFMDKVAKYVRSKGKKPLAWDDAFDEGQNQDITYTFWRDWKGLEAGKITQTGHDLVFGEWSHFYLSADQSDQWLTELYNYDYNDNFPGILSNKLKGFQASTFTEFIPNRNILFQHAFPAIQVFSERCWSHSRDWDSFKRRLKNDFSRMDQKGIIYRKMDL